MAAITTPAYDLDFGKQVDAPKLDTSAVKIANGGSYEFLVKDNLDIENLEVTVTEPEMVSVKLENASDKRGIKYRVMANEVGATQIDVTYLGKTTSMKVEIVPAKGFLMLDTTSYLMAPDDSYTIGTFLRDENGNELTPEQVQNLIDTRKLVVRDSRTGLIFNLTQLADGNIQVTGKKEGVGYVLYEINIHTSVKIVV